MPAAPSWIDVEPAAQGQRAVLRGKWTAGRLASRRGWRQVQRALAQVKPGAQWDLNAPTEIDHVGALVLWQHWGRQWPEQVLLDDPARRALIERVAAGEPAPPARERRSLAALFDALGLRIIEGALQLRDFVMLLGQLLLDALQLVARPDRGPWRDFSGNLYSIGAQALAITALVGFLIGVVLAYLMSSVLRQFGAEAFIVNILGLALIRELGPLLAAVLIAGRSGSTITAQIGVMRVTEELDAMRVLGIPVGFRLVLPRAMALAIVMPLIAVWTTVAALIGGILAANLTLGIGSGYFLVALPRAVPVSNLVLAVGKSAVFGLFIALIGCHFGLRVKPNTESLGQGTTASVVASITAVILLDALFAVVFKNVGL